MQKLVYPLAVVLLALLWQTATVNINYSGNWTALFCTGDLRPTPPALASENIYTFTGSNGFDGQYYHYIAHDPWPGGKMSSYVDAAGIRYCRILLPAAAYLLALGRQQFIDFAYIAAGLAFLFLGVWWFRVFSERSGRPPEWALVFPLLPASMIFFDRLTVDHALAALAAAFVVYAASESSGKLWVVLALAPLARDTGLVLVAAYCLYCLSRRRWKRAAWFATAGLPWLGWSLFVWSRVGHPRYDVILVPLSAVLHWLFHPPHYPPRVPAAWLVQFGDVLALLGMLAAVALACALAARRRRDPVAIAALLYAVAAVCFQKPVVWETVYNYGRIFTPLLVLVAAGWLPSRPWLAALPVALILPRILMQYAPQLMGIAGTLLGIRLT